MKADVRIAFRYGFIALLIQLPVTLALALSKFEGAGFFVWAYEYLLGAFPWIHVFRSPFWDIYSLLPRYAGEHMMISMLAFITSLNWFINGFLIGLVRSRRKEADEKKRVTWKNYMAVFFLACLAHYFIWASCMSVAFTFGVSSDFPENAVLEAIGYVCGFIAYALMMPDTLLEKLINHFHQGLFSIFTYAALVVVVYYLYQRRRVIRES